MANETKPNTELDELAFEIYSKRVAASNRSGEQLAVASYRDAEAFLAVRAKARNGSLESKTADESGLCEVSAPNLKRTHAHNLVSQRFGDLAKVNRIKVWLDRNPTPESDEGELVAKLNREFPELSWDLPTVNTARAIFPAYCKS